VRILFKGFDMVTQMEQQGYYFNKRKALFLQYIFKMKATQRKLSKNIVLELITLFLN